MTREEIQSIVIQVIAKQIDLSPEAVQQAKAVADLGTNELTEISSKVNQVIIKQLGVNPEAVTRQAKFVEDLGADSLDSIELVMALETEFESYELTIPDEHAEKIQTPQDAMDYISQFISIKKALQATTPGMQKIQTE